MKIFRKNIFKFCAVFLIFLLTPLNAQITEAQLYLHNQRDLSFGREAIRHITYLSKTPRMSGTKSIVSAQKYIKNEFQKYGYEIEEQNFNWPIKNYPSVPSKNIIAIKRGLNDKQIIIGAHYDSSNSNGADDNASGVGALLELAQKLNKITLPYNIKFITFDSEELGMFGSRYFVNNMSSEEKSNTILYINIDSILSGDHLYIYGDHGARGWFRDNIIEVANKENIDIKTSKGLFNNNKNGIKILEGECFDYSDHVYFRHEGIPFAYFESTNWDAINENTGYPKYRNEELGMIIHSTDDNIDYIMSHLKNKPLENLQNCISLIYKTLTNNKDKIVITTNVENQQKLQDIQYELYQNNSLIKKIHHTDSNKIILSNLPKGIYKIKKICDDSLKMESIMNDKLFKISDNGSIYILYEETKLIPKTKDYDGMLIGIYGDTFSDPKTNKDEIYKEFLRIKNLDHKTIYNKDFSIEEMENAIKEYNNSINNTDSLPTFMNLSFVKNKLKINSKYITKIITSILITFLCSNFYGSQKSKSL